MFSVFYKLLIFSFLLFAFNLKSNAEDNTKVNFGAYVDTYFGTDNDHSPQIWDSQTASKYRILAPVNAYKDEFALNIAMLSGSIDYKGLVHGKVTYQYGTLPFVAYGQQSGIQEAYAGFKIIDNLWLDAGLFFTHIGGEVYLPKDNWLTSLSMLTYYEPFYHMGAKLTYTTEKFTSSFLVVNGNTVIEDNNPNKSAGLLLGYNASDLFGISYAGIYGNEEPGKPENYELHMLHNVVISSKPVDKLSFKLQFDYSTKKVADPTPVAPSNEKDGKYLGASITARWQMMEKIFLTGRYAYIDNSDGVEGIPIVNSNNTGIPQLKGAGETLGLEYKPTENSYIRIEGNFLNFDNIDLYKLFVDKNGSPTSSRAEVFLNFGVWINN